MDIIQSVKAIRNNHIPSAETGISLVPWMLPTIPEIPHWHDTLEICYCLSGKGVFYFKNREYDIGPGDLVIVNNVERHTSKSYRGFTCSNLFLFFHASTIEQLDFHLLRPFLYDRDRFTHRIPAQLPVAREIGKLILQMQEELAERRPAYGTLIKSLLFHICSLLARHYDAETNGVWQRVYAKYATVRSGLAYIQTHYRENIGLDDVAKAISLSPSRARHLFAEVMGERFKTYLLHLRVQAAQRLLVQTDLPIEDICEQCGFQSTSSFYREFRRLAKETPLSYKKRNSAPCRHPNETLGTDMNPQNGIRV
ncbi:AraC family transcriptional regulator [Paenibacillus mesophilus]|uniref:AraC family transcriptional regulator n=1 Tax=Paenibacillus mesophilus TaxID=2582849 RepID=UPI0013050A89|nr:AraC family transcriptional regulator [Paenibacillus mesophilus]